MAWFRAQSRERWVRMPGRARASVLAAAMALLAGTAVAPSAYAQVSDPCADLAACNVEKAAVQLEIEALARLVESCQEQVREALEQAGDLMQQIEQCQDDTAACFAEQEALRDQLSACQDSLRACLANLENVMQQLRDCLGGGGNAGGGAATPGQPAPGGPVQGGGTVGGGESAGPVTGVIIGIIADELIDAICRRLLAQCERDLQTLKDRRDAFRALLDECEALLEQVQQGVTEAEQILADCQATLAACQDQKIALEADLILCQAMSLECQRMTADAERWLEACQGGGGQGSASTALLGEIHDTVGIDLMRGGEAPGQWRASVFRFVNQRLTPPGSGDLNGDGVINSDDYYAFMNQFLEAEVDYNNDGRTDLADFRHFLDLMVNG